MPKPAKRALENAGLATKAALTQATDQELLHLHGFGPKALKIIREALET
nr:DNA-directed RNA polymerase subunit alpha C-terminal domain-containing protein [Neobacillus jeddahensis]